MLTSTPKLLPNDILQRASATPPYPTAYAATMSPDAMRLWTKSQLRLSAALSGMRLPSGLCLTRYSRSPSHFSSGLMTEEAFTVVTPNATRVGGTLIWPNVPLMESLPPMDGSPSSACIRSPPSRAAMGLPQLWGSEVIFSKYSWNENRILSQDAPHATALAHASTTAYAAPW